jgi:serine/threonine-protein kinase
MSGSMTDPRIGTVLAGYRIESMLGRGGMSVVYLAEDLRLKRRAALKVLAPELAQDASFRERFIAESELAAGLDHPNVIPIFEAGEADGVLFIAMRYVESTDLKALIQREGRLATERALSIVGQTASALDAAHRQGLVHRDVKPANILVAEGQGAGGADHVYLADFGLTKRAQQRTGLTRTGQFVGTVDYVAPEQIEGKEIDGRTDEYALACVLYECLTGDSPYPKDDETAVLIAHLMDPVPSVRAIRPDLPEAFDRVLQAGMAKLKESRFPDCVSFVKAANEALRGATPATMPPPATFQPAPSAPAGTGGTVAARPPAAFTAPPAATTPGQGTFQAPPAERPPPRRRGRSRWVTVFGAAIAAGLVAAVLVVVLGGGGNGGGGTDGAQSQSPPGTTGTTSVQTFAPGTVIFGDDFSDNSNGWDETTQGGFADGLRNGKYFEEIRQQGTGTSQVFASSAARDPRVTNAGDVVVTVTATKTAGSGKNGYGIGCRTGGGTVSYYFVVSSLGHWAIEKSDAAGQPILATAADPIIKKGNDASNVIQGECVGGAGGTPVTLTMTVNGKKVGQFQDTPAVQTPFDAPGVLPSGTVSLVSVGNKGFTVQFDDLVVRAPKR